MMTAAPAPNPATLAAAFRARHELALASSFGPSYLPAARRAAFARFLELGFPTPKHEEWRHTNLAALERGGFAEPAAGNEKAEEDEEIAAFLRRDAFADFGGERLVFVDGRFAPGLSRLSSRAASLRRAPASQDWSALTREAAWEEFALVALNTALFTDGALVAIARGETPAAPLHILHLATARAANVHIHPRVLILAGRDAQASIIETYASLGEAPAFTNAVIEMVLEENAAVEFARVQRENPAAHHLSAVFSRQARSSRLAIHTLTLGGGVTRNDVTSVLDGEGAETLLNGLYVVGGDQRVDNHTVLDHAKPLGASREYYKGVLDERAVTAFRGRIVVRPDAQHTDAIQSDKNLLLSSDAVANADPQLEIRADDVRCTHGATFGQIDAEALFYLRSRGLAADSARQLLTYAFAADVLGRLKIPELRARVERQLFARWTGLLGDGRA